MTGGGSDAAVLHRKAIAAIVNTVRVIALCRYHFVIAVWRTKAAESGRTPMNTSRKLLMLIVLVAFVVILFVIGNNQNPFQ